MTEALLIRGNFIAHESNKRSKKSFLLSLAELRSLESFLLARRHINEIKRRKAKARRRKKKLITWDTIHLRIPVKYNFASVIFYFCVQFQ
jgi:hypothetical protein